jgi:NitT/TauT family transport system ATP-binding protein
MAFQAPNLLPWRRTLENILLPLEIVQPHRSRLRSEREAYVAKVETLLSQVGLKASVRSSPGSCRAACSRRASLCRALIHEPQLLMLDEPFGALDSFTREELWCVIRDLHAARPVTIILVTHDLREAAFLADRIFCMSARPGRIIAERRVTLSAPAQLDVTYTAEFTRIVHDLRQQIATARQAA